MWISLGIWRRALRWSEADLRGQGFVIGARQLGLEPLSERVTRSAFRCNPQMGMRTWAAIRKTVRG